MAGTMIHVLVAMKLLDSLQKKRWKCTESEKILQNPDLFIAGNICPDGVMARKNYVRDMKLHTHFRDGIPDGEFGKEGTISIFEKRMKAFYYEHREDEKQNPGLYLGYVTHMITDEYFILEERPVFFENIAKIGLTQHDCETFEIFNQETDMVDFRLIKEYPELTIAQKKLEGIRPYEIKGMITMQELTRSRQWILNHFFNEEHTIQQNKYLHYDRMLTFIERVVSEIEKNKIR